MQRSLLKTNIDFYHKLKIDNINFIATAEFCLYCFLSLLDLFGLVSPALIVAAGLFLSTLLFVADPFEVERRH